ncbi:MAG TPA: hypothetical protein VFM93_10960 [Candidatus Limnocylindria bacterium]|nr:hypothetical protein [Candidatus Limnocylindria bacterium]
MLERIVPLLLGSKTQLVVARKGPAPASLFAVGRAGSAASGTTGEGDVAHSGSDHRDLHRARVTARPSLRSLKDTAERLVTEAVRTAARSDSPALRRRLLYAGAVLFAVAGTVALLSSTAPRAGAPAAPAAAPTAATRPAALQSVAAPADAGRAWRVTKVWQGSGSRETEEFVVGADWRVDWLFAPASPGSAIQVFIYSVDGRLLLDLAANTQNAGADSSFWRGAGRYYLKVSATGDWKLAVQELR